MMMMMMGLNNEEVATAIAQWALWDLSLKFCHQGDNDYQSLLSGPLLVHFRSTSGPLPVHSRSTPSLLPLHSRFTPGPLLVHFKPTSGPLGW